MQHKAWPLALLLAACGGGHHPRPIPPPQTWTAEFSHGCQIAGNVITIPTSDGCHYVTKPSGSLSSASRISLSYRIDLGEGVVLKPSSDPNLPAIGPTIYFQVCNDDMRTDGNRWWATFNSPVMEAGTHELVAEMKAKWTSVMTMNAIDNGPVFERARANTCKVGFTLGGGTGYGHGVYATGPATLTILDFRIE